jgi:hypothetical protein
MEDEDNRVEWVERDFYKVPVNSRKIVYICPAPPHFLYTKDRQGRFVCCTTANFLRPYKPVHLLTASKIDHCIAKPDNDDDHHSHNTRGDPKKCDSGGPTLAEIGLLYVKWAIREEAAHGPTETSYTERTQIVENALKKLESKGIPSRDIITTTIESFTIDSIQKSIESASIRASIEQAAFPNPSAEVLALNLWKSGWTVVEESSESETDPAPSTSQERERSRSPRARKTFKELVSEPLCLRGPEPEEDTIVITIKDGTHVYHFEAPKGAETLEIAKNKKTGYHIKVPPPPPF